MRKWMHPQGLAALLAGIYAVLCPIWTTTPTENKAQFTMIGLGVITAVLALSSLAMPGRVAFDGLIVLMGLLFIVSPWVMSFTAFTALERTAWIVGIVALLAGAADVTMSRAERSGHGVVTNG